MEPRINPTETQRIALRRKMDAAVVALALNLPLDQARSLPDPQRRDLQVALSEVLSAADRRRVSRLWEPQRRLDQTNGVDLLGDLRALLAGERQPYERSKLSLAEAQGLRGDQRAQFQDTIKRLAPLNDLKSLVRRWDRHNRAMPDRSRKEIAGHLCALMDATVDPHPAPPRSSTRSNTRSSARARAATA